MLDLLKSEYPVIQSLALKTLGVITNDKESQAMLRDNQGVDHLIKILETKVFVTFINFLWGNASLLNVVIKYELYDTF